MSGFTPSDEQIVNFIRQGQGAPAILIHGLAASLFDWVDLTPELTAAGYAVYALDLLGHGQSLKPKQLDQYHIDRIFEHLERWINSLQLDQPLTLVGHSLGGYLAIEYALRYPERVRALVLTDAFYTLDQLSPLLRFHYKRPLINLGLISYAPEWLIRLSIELGGLFIRNGYVVPKSKAARAQTANDYKRSSPGIYNILSTTRDLTPVLAQVAAPVLVIWGAHDQSLSPKYFTKLAATMPNTRVVTIHSGHVPHQSHADEFNRHVLAFLRTVEGDFDTPKTLLNHPNDSEISPSQTGGRRHRPGPA
jgi:pimeloyl-ACP methyl ester carboxylesterase